MNFHLLLGAKPHSVLLVSPMRQFQHEHSYEPSRSYRNPRVGAMQSRGCHTDGAGSRAGTPVPALGEDQHSCHDQLTTALGMDCAFPSTSQPSPVLSQPLKSQLLGYKKQYQEEISATVQGGEFPKHTNQATTRQST